MSEESNIPKVYDPKSFEKKWYEYWEKNNLFHAEVEEDKDPYSIVIPPPNVTGQLHMGHAMDNTLQDILIRWRRMQGYNTLWMPGCDHAGIATQAKVEEALRKEGKSRYDLGREKFLERVWEWKEEYGNRIMFQLRTLGSSCDWERQRFTMDDYREILSHVDPAEQVAFNVPSGHSSDIALSDGSVVSLHPGSRLAFPAKFTNTERVVKLEGEAYFNVVHDSRPFIVMTNQTETTVLGTEFNINTHDGSATTVTLVKGRVQVKNKNLKDNDKVLLGPGMQTVVKEGTFTTQEQIDTKPYSYWAEGYLFYDNAELQDVMRKVGQMYNMTVEFKNTDIMHLKLRFFAERKAGLDAVINRLNSMRRFHVTRSGNTLFVD